MTGVYAIWCKVNNKVYVGSAAANFEKRWSGHRWGLQQNRHPNKHLQGAWNAYSEDAFEFVELEFCPPSHCVEREQFWIDLFDAANPALGYNLRAIAKSNLGIKFPRELVERNAARMRGRKRPPEVVEKIRAILKGTVHGPEVRARMSAGQKGKKHSQATKEKMSKTRKGRKYSESHREAIRAGLLGRSSRMRAELLASIPAFSFMQEKQQ